MGMDYSYLFGGMDSTAGSASGNWLADYASIKNGSYGKLMKAYYADAKAGAPAQGTAAETAASKRSSKNILEKLEAEKRNPKVSKDVQKANADLTTGISALNTSLSTLRGDKTYTDTAGGQSAADKTVSAVKAYVADYNSVVGAAKNSTLTNKTAYVANVMSSTAANAGKLAEIGVTVNTDGTLFLDEKKLKTAGVSKVQELFSAREVTSYGSAVASRLQFAGAAAGTGTAGSAAADSASAETTAASSAYALKTDSRALASDDLYARVKDKDGRETDQYDAGKILATAKSFVANYNGMFDTAASSSNSGVVSNLAYIREKTAGSADALKQFGFSVDGKGKMKLDEDVFGKADMSKVQKFFKDYGASIATNASLVNYYMTTQANAANGYTAAGAYNVQGGTRYTTNT